LTAARERAITGAADKMRAKLAMTPLLAPA